MFIKYFDYLSPRVTFYYKGYLSHSSILSGVLSIIAITFIIILAVYYSLNIINRQQPNTFYFHSFIEDAGLFQFNTSSLFHFINVVYNYKGIIENQGIDFSVFNIIGANMYVNSYINLEKNDGKLNFDHWLYGYCNKDNNTYELDDLINFDFFEKCACIKKYFNHTEKKYYEIGDTNFVWPEIAYGTFNDHNKLYGIFIQRCNNYLINEILGDGNQCKNETEFKNYFNERGSKVMNLYFINNYINVVNYSNPNNKFFYKIENPINKDQYSTNDININPALVKSHDGYIFDHVKEDISYMFDRNDVYIKNNEGKNIYLSYCFFLKNIMEYYERIYKRLQDVISSIGGISQTISIIAFYLNILYNKFIVLSDTEILLHSSIHNEKTIHKKKTIEYNKLKHKMKDIEKKNDLSDKKNNSERNKIIDEKQNYNTKNVNDISKSNNNIINIEKNFNNTFDLNLTNFKKDNTNNNNNKGDTIEHKGKLNFCNYIFYKITCKKKNYYFKVYENFRIKIISEEHLIRNHLNIYNLLKVTENKRHIRRNSYQLKDLIKLV